MPTGRSLTPAEVETIRLLRDDGLIQSEVAEALGLSARTVRRYAPGRLSHVPVAPLRVAFTASGKTYTEVCRALGWECRRPWGLAADTSRLKRTLGLQTECDRSRKRRETVRVDVAYRLADAIGVAAWEVLPG